MKKLRRPRKFSWYLTWVFILLIFCALTAAISMPFCQIKNIKVSAIRYTDKSEITRLAQVAVGQNIVFVNLDEIYRKLREFTLIKDVRIKRFLPSTLFIEIIEREEAAAGVIGEKAVIFDEEGFVLNFKDVASDKADLLSFSDLPVIVGIKAEDIKEGRLAPEMGELLKSILVDCKKHLTADKIKVDLKIKNGIVILVDDFIKVKIGEAIEVDRKIRVFETLRDHEQNRLTSIDYIDVSVPDNPVVKFKT